MLEAMTPSPFPSFNIARRSAAKYLGLTHSLIDEITQGPVSQELVFKTRSMGPLQVMIALLTSDLPLISTRGSAAENLGLTHSLIDERTHGPDSLESWPEDRTEGLQVMIALLTSDLPLTSTQGSAAEDLGLTHFLSVEGTHGPDNLKSGLEDKTLSNF